MNTRRLLPAVLLVAGIAAHAEDTVEISDKQQATRYFNEQGRQLWRENTVALTAIDEQYKRELEEQSAEHSRRLNALSQQIADDHKALAAREMDQAERRKAHAGMQARHKSDREAVAAWRTENSRAARERHQQRRADQWEVHNERLAQHKRQRAATLDRLASGPVMLTSIPPSPTNGAGTTAPPPDLSTGQAPAAGVDLGGSVNVAQPGNELVTATAAQDQQLLREQLYRAEQDRARRAEQEQRERNTPVDGFLGQNDPHAVTDCDDGDPAVYPGAPEVCNYKDSNCDGFVDGGRDYTLRREVYLDRDGDLHGDASTRDFLCPQTTRDEETGGYMVIHGNDCDDTDPGTWFGCDEG